MFVKKKTVLFTSPIILLSIFFIDLFIISAGQCIYIYILYIYIYIYNTNTNTGLMIKKINKKYTLTCIHDKKGQ